MNLWLNLQRMWTARREGAETISLFVLFSPRISLGYISCDRGNVMVLCQFTNHHPHGVPTFFGRMDFCGN